MNMIPQASIQNTTQNNPNLTTLFVPNGVFRAKPNLKLPLILSKSPPKKSQERTLNRKRRPAVKTRSRGRGRRPSARQQVAVVTGDGWQSPALPWLAGYGPAMPQRPSCSLAWPVAWSFLSSFCPSCIPLCGTCLIYVLPTKLKKTNKKLKDYIIKRTKN